MYLKSWKFRANCDLEMFMGYAMWLSPLVKTMLSYYRIREQEIRSFLKFQVSDSMRGLAGKTYQIYKWKWNHFFLKEIFCGIEWRQKKKSLSWPFGLKYTLEEDVSKEISYGNYVCFFILQSWCTKLYK